MEGRPARVSRRRVRAAVSRDSTSDDSDAIDGSCDIAYSDSPAAANAMS